MSTEPNQPTEPGVEISDEARTAVGAPSPKSKRPYPRRFSLTHGGRKGRMRERHLLSQRPILGHLVTHRRRFTTGHKSKQR